MARLGAATGDNGATPDHVTYVTYRTWRRTHRDHAGISEATGGELGGDDPGHGHRARR